MVETAWVAGSDTPACAASATASRRSLAIRLSRKSGSENRSAAIRRALKAITGEANPLRLGGYDTGSGQQVLDLYHQVYATGRAESVRDLRIQLNRPDTGEQVE